MRYLHSFLLFVHTVFKTWNIFHSYSMTLLQISHICVWSRHVSVAIHIGQHSSQISMERNCKKGVNVRSPAVLRDRITSTAYFFRHLSFSPAIFLQWKCGDMDLMKKTKRTRGTFLVIQWIRLCLPMQGLQVRPLVSKLRSCMPHSQNTKA